jgi:hypothetical protein
MLFPADQQSWRCSGITIFRACGLARLDIDGAFPLLTHVPNRANRQAERESPLGVDHHKTAFIPSEIKVTSRTREPDGLVHQWLSIYIIAR